MILYKIRIDMINQLAFVGIMLDIYSNKYMKTIDIKSTFDELHRCNFTLVGIVRSTIISN